MSAHDSRSRRNKCSAKVNMAHSTSSSAAEEAAQREDRGGCRIEHTMLLAYIHVTILCMQAMLHIQVLYTPTSSFIVQVMLCIHQIPQQSLNIHMQDRAGTTGT